MMMSRIVSVRSLFRHLKHKQGHMQCNGIGCSGATQLSEQSAIQMLENGLWQPLTFRTRQHRTSGRHDEKMVACLK